MGLLIGVAPRPVPKVVSSKRSSVHTPMDAENNWRLLKCH